MRLGYTADALFSGGTWTSAQPGKCDLENHGLIAIKKNAVFHVPADGAREYDFLKVAAFADEIFDGVTVGDADDILLDDRTIVENFCDVVAGCADQLYPALEGLVVRLGTDESGKKRVVNVDDALRITTDEIVGENLHVAGEDYEVGFVIFDQRADLFFGLLLVVFCDQDDGIRDFVEVGDGLVVGVIRNDQRDVAGEFSTLMAVQQINKAVIVL